MELSDVGEHVFAAQRILKQRIRKVRVVSGVLLGFFALWLFRL